MKIINQNILNIEKGIICQQVNCQGVMGSGLAKQIREKWPIVYKHGYLPICENYKPDFLCLGQYTVTEVSDGLFVGNIFGQLNYGVNCAPAGTPLRYTDYGALKIAFSSILSGWLIAKENQFYFPYNFGCDRGGGDWKIVGKMIDYYFPDAIICRL